MGSHNRNIGGLLDTDAFLPLTTVDDDMLHQFPLVFKHLWGSVCLIDVVVGVDVLPPSTSFVMASTCFFLLHLNLKWYLLHFQGEGQGLFYIWYNWPWNITKPCSSLVWLSRVYWGLYRDVEVYINACMIMCMILCIILDKGIYMKLYI